MKKAFSGRLIYGGVYIREGGGVGGGGGGGGRLYTEEKLR